MKKPGENKTRKAINFDLRQEKLEKHYNKSPAMAYYDTKKFFKKIILNGGNTPDMYQKIN